MNIHLAKPILSITYRDEDVLRDFLNNLKVQRMTEPKAFPSIQSYYSKEMGENLKKLFLSLHGLIDARKLADFKIWAMKKEVFYAIEGRRRLNIDPGYVDTHHLVLASSKRRGGRLPIGNGVYAEIEYLYLYGGFRSLYWTYADYREKENVRFF